MMWFHIAWTIALFIVFVAIICWAWSRGRNEDFREASQLPLEDDRDVHAREVDRRSSNG